MEAQSHIDDIQMTDRELLELAAKAAGKDLTQWKWLRGGGFWWHDDEGFITSNKWNPLEVDGDALRLAVKLEMEISLRTRIRVMYPHPMPTEQYGTLMMPTPVYEDRGDDVYGAIRRAIVRAAAEIGRVM